MQAYKQIIKSTGIDFFTFYGSTSAENFHHQLEATTGALTLTSVLMVFLKEFFHKVDFVKNQQTIEKHAKLPSM